MQYNILVGGAAGEGSKKAGHLVAKLMSNYGYRTFIHEDYQSLVKGGHNFSYICVSPEKIDAVNEKLDVILALNKDTVDRHEEKLKEEGVLIYNSDTEDLDRGVSVSLNNVVEKAEGTPIMKNTALIAFFAKTMGMSWEKTEEVLRREMPIETETNIRVAKEAFSRAEKIIEIEDIGGSPLPIISGNEAVALGAIAAGMSDFFAYPMTPSTGILHFLSNVDGVTATQMESELAVVSAALGSAYSGRRTMVGTSGGGFALMTESVSFAAQAELPLVIALSQRMGPGTGVPTYTSQGDLLFALYSGHGDLTRFVVAPGDADEAFELSAKAMNISWKYKLPAIILLDKELSENSYSFKKKEVENIVGENIPKKVTGYEHNADGISTELKEEVEKMQNKKEEKYQKMTEELSSYPGVKTYGEGEDIVLFWGSNKGVVLQATKDFNVKVVQIVVFQPFPKEMLLQVLGGANRIISVENNMQGQASSLVENSGISIDEKILKYDGRPFTVENLRERIKKSLQ